MTQQIYIQLAGIAMIWLIGKTKDSCKCNLWCANRLACKNACETQWLHRDFLFGLVNGGQKKREGSSKSWQCCSLNYLFWSDKIYLWWNVGRTHGLLTPPTAHNPKHFWLSKVQYKHWQKFYLCFLQRLFKMWALALLLQLLDSLCL